MIACAATFRQKKVCRALSFNLPFAVRDCKIVFSRPSPFSFLPPSPLCTLLHTRNTCRGRVREKKMHRAKVGGEICVSRKIDLPSVEAKPSFVARHVRTYYYNCVLCARAHRLLLARQLILFLSCSSSSFSLAFGEPHKLGSGGAAREEKEIKKFQPRPRRADSNPSPPFSQKSGGRRHVVRESNISGEGPLSPPFSDPSFCL